MMMNDLRETPAPPVDGGSTPKIVAALIVALGFGAIGAYSYETGTWNSQPKQVVASSQPPAPESVASAAPSESPPPSLADLPPAPPPAPVKDIPAQTSPKTAATAPVRVARAQAPALPQAPEAQPTANVSDPAAPAVATPAETVPEKRPRRRTAIYRRPRMRCRRKPLRKRVLRQQRPSRNLAPDSGTDLRR